MGERRLELPETCTVHPVRDIGATREAPPLVAPPSLGLLGTTRSQEPPRMAEPRVEDVFREGAEIGRYRIGVLLGSGGMGRVYAAHDRRLDRTVALKVLKRSGASAQRLRREAQALGRLNHPNVVAVYEVDVVDGRTYVAMEYVPGMTLRDWVEHRHRSLHEVLEVFIAAGRGLAAAHATGIVHRDFKPDNVIVGEDGRIRVADFGLAWVRSDVSSESDIVGLGDGDGAQHGTTGDLRLTRIGARIGTAHYMSPEQYLGEDAGPASDQFSFCVALHEAIYGELPFQGESLEELCEAVLEAKLKAPSRIRSWRLHAIVRRGLARNEGDRYPDLPTLLAELEALARPRRWPTIAALGVACAAVLAFPAFDEPAQCPAGDEMAAAWQHDARPQIEQAFTSTGAFGVGQWRRLRGVLDDHVERWREVYRRTCHADRRTLAPEAQDATMQCLVAARRRFHAVTRVFAEADATTVTRAHDLTRELDDPSACLSARHGDVASARPAPQWDADLDYVEALLVAGRHRSAEPFARRLVATADETRRPRALLALATVQTETLPPEAARRSLEEAALAARTRGDERSFARASALLTSHLAQTMRDYDSAATWARHALASPSTRRDRKLQARLFNARGIIEHERGDADAALREHARALAVLEPDDGSALYARTKHHVGNVLFFQARYDDAIAAYEDAHEAWRRALGDEHPDVAIPLVGLAILHCQRDDCERSRPLLEDVLARWTAAHGPEHVQVGNVLNSLGVLELQLGDNASAQRHLERALEVHRAAFGPEHPVTAKREASVALAARVNGDWPRCVAHAQRSVTLFERAFGADSIQVTGPLGSLSRCTLALGDAMTAAHHARRELALFEALLGPDDLDLFDALEPLAEAQRAMGRRREAIETYRRALAIADARAPQSTIAAMLSFGLARVLAEHRGRTREAIALAKRARSIYEGNPTRKPALREVLAWLAGA